VSNGCSEKVVEVRELRVSNDISEGGERDGASCKYRDVIQK